MYVLNPRFCIGQLKWIGCWLFKSSSPELPRKGRFKYRFMFWFGLMKLWSYKMSSVRLTHVILHQSFSLMS